MGVFLMCAGVPGLMALETPIEITDDMGRTITFDKPVERVAFAHPSAGEGILLAGGWDKVVGRDATLSNTDFYPNLDEIPVINSPNNPHGIDFEKATSVAPDVVVIQWVGDKDAYEKMVQALEPDIKVVMLDFCEPENADNIVKLGKILGTSDKADAYAAFHDQVIDSIKSKTNSLSDSEKPNIFLDSGGMGTETITTYGKQAPFWGKMCDIAGGKSIAADLPGGRSTVDLEWLINQDIDDIIVQCFYEKGKLSAVGESKSFGYMATDPAHATKEADSIISDVKNLEVYANSDAVKNNKIFIQFWELANNPKSFIGTAYIAKWIHPELFEDLDPKQIHQEYLNTYIGSDIDLDNVGILAYP
ncbi:ABC transporter substrate-binding protein [Methanospirillum stamsii]|nr:ABC transporter substrate-binding protein [Methanospirillum stamsii]